MPLTFPESQNYTLGRGRIFFSRFVTDTETPEGFYYIGNTPEFSMTMETEDLDHFSSDQGIREKDDSVPLEVTRSGSLITDNIDPANIALFFFGTDQVLTQGAVAPALEALTNIKAGHYYRLGITPSAPAGVRGIDPAGFTIADNPGATALVAGTDYNIDNDTGIVHFLDGSAVAIDGADIDVTYGLLATTRDRVISGTTPVEGAMMFQAFNPKGDNFDYYMPKVKVTPNGDYALKGDEWQQIPFSIEMLKPTNGDAIYMDGRPV